MSVTTFPASGGHTHGAADLRTASPAGYVLLDDGTFGTLTAAAVSAYAIDTGQIADLAVTTEKIAADAVTSAELDPGTVQVTVVVLSSAQVKALRATPRTLVAAPGADLVLEFLSAWLFLDYGSEVFTESADNLGIFYAGETVAVSSAIETTGFLDQAEDMIMEVRPQAAGQMAAKASLLNKALTLKNSGDGEIGGNASNDSLLRVRVVYRVHTAGF